jgi:hypothetical protein
MLLAQRTDVEARYLTYFVVDMPGVEVRPLVQLTGDAEFNEVSSTTRIPDSMRRTKGRRWHVAITTDERAVASRVQLAVRRGRGQRIDRLIASPAVGDPAPARLAAAYIDNQLIRWNNQRAADRRRRGSEAGPEGSITKLMQAEYNQRLQKLAVDLEGPYAAAWEGDGLAHQGGLGWVPTNTSDHRSVCDFLRSQAAPSRRRRTMRNILGERARPARNPTSRATCRGRTSPASGPIRRPRATAPAPEADPRAHAPGERPGDGVVSCAGCRGCTRRAGSADGEDARPASRCWRSSAPSHGVAGLFVVPRMRI